MLFRRLFGWPGTPTSREDPTDYELSQSTAGGLEAEYQKLISAQLLQWGVPQSCASVEVRLDSVAPSRRETFVAVVRISAWERTPVLRLLLGLPLLERKLRKAIKAHWVGELSDFGGVLLHASGELQDEPAVSDLRRTMISLTEGVAGRNSPAI